MGNFSRKNNIIIVSIFILCYLLPAFIQFDFNKEQRIIGLGVHLPRVSFGDEPHYLIATNSFIKDLDLEISNNYNNALYNNELDAGRKFQGLLSNDRRDFYLLNKTNFNYIRYANGSIRQEYNHMNNTNFYYLTQIPPGMPIFTGSILYLFNKNYVEAGAILLSVFITLIGLLFLYRILVRFSNDKKVSLFFVFIFAFATPIWFYSKTFLADIYITNFLIIGLYYFLRDKFFFSGLILGIGVLFKYNFLILIIPFLIYALSKNKFHSFKLVMGLLPSGILQMLYNYYFFRNLTNTGRLFPYHNFLEGLIGIITSYKNGILFFAPFLLFSIFGIRRFYNKWKKESLLIYSIILLQYLFTSIIFWWGGESYSNRYMLPIIPLLSLPMLFWYKENKSKKLRNLFYIITIISIIINLQAALFSALFLNKPPWELLNIFIYKSERIFNLLT